MADVAERQRSWESGASALSYLAKLFDVPSASVTVADLLPDCGEERRLAASLRAHAAPIVYPAYRETMEGVADETEGHADALADLLRSNGVEPPAQPDVPDVTAYPDMVRNVQADGEIVKRRIVRYQDLLADAPKAIRRILTPIYEEKRNHVRLLVNVAVRISR